MEGKTLLPDDTGSTSSIATLRHRDPNLLTDGLRDAFPVDQII